jgi:hypothetical protein
LKRGKIKIDNAVQERLANAVVRKCIALQERWAYSMQRNLEKFSVTGKKYMVLLFCVLSGGYSIFLVAENILRATKKLPLVSVIKMPSHVLETGEPKKKYLFISPLEYRKIEGFKHYMDSLEKTKIASKKYDSIVRQRPKLLDSIIQIEKIYKQQNK